MLKNKLLAVFSILLLVLIPAFSGQNKIVLALGDNHSRVSPLMWPEDRESAISVIDTGKILTHGEQRTAPIASVSKLITALCVLQIYPLRLNQSGPRFLINNNDIGIYTKYLLENGSDVPVSLGEQLSEYQMLSSMLIPSANNIADSLAIKVFGSLANYQSFANSYVMRLGLNHTHIGSDASGFSPSTISTAFDLVKLGEIVMHNQVLASIVSQTTAPGLTNGKLMQSTNSILGRDGVVGIKTGYTNPAGGVFLSASELSDNGQKRLVITSTIGEPSLNKALSSTALLIQSADIQIITTGNL